MKRWTVNDSYNSIQNASCLMCKKQRTAKESEIAFSFSFERGWVKNIVCNECFEKDIFCLDSFNKEGGCGICFVCDEKIKETVPYDASETKDTYTFEIIKDRTAYCIHIHKECFEGNVSDEWLFDGDK